MKTILRKSEARFLTQIDWLTSRHTFSFGEHYDPSWMGFFGLKVINDDWIRPNKGFPFHPHKNMEIITFMLQGKLRHKDSLDNNGLILPGEIQVMTAGTGIIHSEFCESDTDEDVHLLQIWVMPSIQNLKPSYGQNKILTNALGLSLVFSSDKAPLNLWQGRLAMDSEMKFTPQKYQKIWIHMISGTLNLNEFELNEGDGLGLYEGIDGLVLKNTNSTKEVHFLLFELE